jgi:hypothetical protein
VITDIVRKEIRAISSSADLYHSRQIPRRVRRFGRDALAEFSCGAYCSTSTRTRWGSRICLTRLCADFYPPGLTSGRSPRTPARPAAPRRPVQVLAEPGEDAIAWCPGPRGHVELAEAVAPRAHVPRRPSPCKKSPLPVPREQVAQLLRTARATVA